MKSGPRPLCLRPWQPARAATCRLRHNDDDLAGWAYGQAETLQLLRPAGVDWENIAEELKDLGNAQFKGFVSAVQLVMAHMLKWDMQPQRRGNSRANTIGVQRDTALGGLAANPGFKARIEEAMVVAWRRGIRDASSAMDIPLRAMPQTCPYGWDELMFREIDWPEA